MNPSCSGNKPGYSVLICFELEFIHSFLAVVQQLGASTRLYSEFILSSCVKVVWAQPVSIGIPPSQSESSLLFFYPSVQPWQQGFFLFVFIYFFNFIFILHIQTAQLDVVTIKSRHMVPTVYLIYYLSVHQSIDHLSELVALKMCSGVTCCFW